MLDETMGLKGLNFVIYFTFSHFLISHSELDEFS